MSIDHLSYSNSKKTLGDNHQLLDEADHDVKNCTDRGYCYPSAKLDKSPQALHTSSHFRMIVLLSYLGHRLSLKLWPFSRHGFRILTIYSQLLTTRSKVDFPRYTKKEWRAHNDYRESIFWPGTMRFTIAFDLRLPHNLMEPMWREL